MAEVNNEPLTPLSVDADTRDRIAGKWMALMERKLNDGSINATESAILMRVMLASGYTLDPTRLPQDLRSKLTESIPDEELEDYGIVGRIAAEG